MSNVLDHILKKDLFDTTTMNGNFTSDSFEIDRAEGGFMVTITLDAGNGSVDMNFSLEYSSDNVSFSEDLDSIQTFTDDDGSILYDVLDTNATYGRIKIIHTAGSIDASAKFTAQRRH